jgi:hypothetical protein
VKPVTREQLAAEFERICRLPEVMRKVQFPLGRLEINGELHGYTDSDTDSAWIGFNFGFKAAQRCLADKPREA